jgi:hypothetical protein
VIPFGVTQTPLRSVIHNASFLHVGVSGLGKPKTIVHENGPRLSWSRDLAAFRNRVCN